MSRVVSPWMAEQFVREQERRLCCAAICPLCASGNEAKRDGDGQWLHQVENIGWIERHEEPWRPVECAAGAIYERGRE